MTAVLWPMPADETTITEVRKDVNNLLQFVINI